MKLVRISKPGQPDLHIHEDAVAQHEDLGWTVLGDEEVAPPEAVEGAGAGDGEGAGSRPDRGQGADDAAARKAAIREQLKAMGAELPHHAAGVEKHEAALAAAQAAQAVAGLSDQGKA